MSKLHDSGYKYKKNVYKTVGACTRDESGSSIPSEVYSVTKETLVNFEALRLLAFVIFSILFYE